jgi:hypothetical protein
VGTISGHKYSANFKSCNKMRISGGAVAAITATETGALVKGQAYFTIIWLDQRRKRVQRHCSPLPKRIVAAAFGIVARERFDPRRTIFGGLTCEPDGAFRGSDAPRCV